MAKGHFNGEMDSAIKGNENKILCLGLLIYYFFLYNRFFKLEMVN